MSDENSEQSLNLVQELQEWISKLPQLPQNLGNRFLLRFLHSCNYDLEDTKKALELFFTIRSASPELVRNRDPLSPQMQKMISIIKLARIYASGNRNIWVWQLNDPGLKNYDYVEGLKLFFLNTDSWLLEDDKLEEEDIVILDVKDMSLKFITKLNLTVAKKFIRYQQEALPIRLKQIHVVNASAIFDKVFSLMKPLIKKGMKDKIYVHTSNFETVYKFISTDDLPKDFGGKLDSMEEQMKHVLNAIMRNRDFFLNDNNAWTVPNVTVVNKEDVNKRKDHSLRNLDID